MYTTLLIITYIVKYLKAMYTQYCPDHLTKMSANVQYIPIRQTYCSPNFNVISTTHNQETAIAITSSYAPYSVTDSIYNKGVFHLI